MNFDKLTEELKKHKIKVGMFKKKLYRQIADMIPDGAEIVAAAEGLAKDTPSAIPVIVTPEKVYMLKYAGLMGGLSSAVISRSSITGVDVTGGILSTVFINTTGERYEITKVARQQAMEISRALA